MDIAKPSICNLDSLHNFFPYSMLDTYLAKAFVDNLACLGQERDCTFIVNSHPSKSGIDEGTGQHGARAWHNAVRARVYVTIKDKTDPDSPLIVTHMKNQYGPKLPPFGVRYDLDQHVYVLDEEATEDAKSLSVQQQKALKLLKKAIDEAGEIPPGSNHIPANVRCVRTSLWRAYCEQGSITQSDKPDTRRTAFNRAAEVLDNRDKIGVWGDWVWEART
jgi:RecA-family ATPase